MTQHFEWRGVADWARPARPAEASLRCSSCTNENASSVASAWELSCCLWQKRHNDRQTCFVKIPVFFRVFKLYPTFLHFWYNCCCTEVQLLHACMARLPKSMMLHTRYQVPGDASRPFVPGTSFSGWNRSVNGSTLLIPPVPSPTEDVI